MPLGHDETLLLDHVAASLQLLSYLADRSSYLKRRAISGMWKGSAKKYMHIKQNDVDEENKRRRDNVVTQHNPSREAR